MTWQVNAQFDGGSVSGDATTNVNISDFGMSPPKAGPVLSIQDGLTLELNFAAAALAVSGARSRRMRHLSGAARSALVK